jgi:hypothetical protein
VGQLIGDPGKVGSQAEVVAVVTVLARLARWDVDHAVQRATDLWLAAAMDSGSPPPGGVLVNEADPRRLGVHAAISVPGAPDGIPPEYVPRDADEGEPGVRARVAAASGAGGFVLLVGGSSVGKTRCAYEAVAARQSAQCYPATAGSPPRDDGASRNCVPASAPSTCPKNGSAGTSAPRPRQFP